jgi:quercetin dioxygenase-like cupin family protein
MEEYIFHHFSDGLYAKEVRVPKGSFLVKHVHPYSHLSILAKGTVRMTKGEEVEVVQAPACINVEANKVHSIVSLEDCVWFCIHATEETDAENIDKVLIEKEV